MGALFLFLLLVWGCGGGGGGSDHADGLPGAREDSQENFHPSGFATDPQHGQDYNQNQQYCRACHGDNLRGGSSGVSCVECHHGFVELYCDGCHDATNLNSHGTHTQGTARGPDAMGCPDCHFGQDKALIPDACDDCHSPGGAFDGVQMGLDNWDDVYESDGETLRSGQDNWCLSCHDDDPDTVDNESSLIQGVYAPNIAGDENNGDTYGFNITGHKINCLDCHVADKEHIDGEHRTYEVANDGQANQEVVNPYLDGYRLPDGSMRVPAPAGAAVIDVSDYGLCFECHNPDEVLGEDLDQDDVSQTNFWDSAPQVTAIGNAHNYHVRVGSLRGDTDWDGVVDARETCISCHTVHGSPTGMLRNGQLISTPGTTDKVPALNFTYVVTSMDLATATWTSPPLDAGIYEVQVHVPTDVLDNHAGDARYTVSHDGGANVEVLVDQQIDGGVWVSLGANFSYNQGSTGTVVLDNDFTTGVWVLADAVRWVGGTTYLVDNPDATFSTVEDWLTWGDDPGTWNFIGDDFRYTGRPTPNPDASAMLAQSVGGWTRYGSGAIAANHICRACHSQGPALYQRTPNLWPKVLSTPGPVPDTVSNNGTESSLITVTVSDPDNNVGTVTIDLTPIGGGAAQSMTANGDGSYSYTLNIAAGTTDAEYDFVVTATDQDANTGSGEVALNVLDPNATYVDNVDATVSPDCSPPCDASTEWAYFTTDQAFEENFRYKERDPAGTGTVIWTPTIPETANYEVYAWWDDGSTLANPLTIRSKNVSYAIEVSADGGSTWSELTSFTVDQTIEGPGGGQWNQLGSDSYTFSSGVSARVVLFDDATLAPVGGGITYVIGDAVKFVQVP